MGNFQRGGKFGEKRFGGQRSWGRGDKGPRQMFKAVCDECGNECEVPFRPNGSRRVFCTSCFKKNGGEAPASADRIPTRTLFDDKRMFEAQCDRCGERCEVPFRPTGERPVYCRACFGRDGGAGGGKGGDQVKVQLEALNAKMDRLIKLLTASSSEQAVVRSSEAKTTSTEENSSNKGPKTAVNKSGAEDAAKKSPSKAAAPKKKVAVKKNSKTGKKK